jgi:DNA-directed RNA polymerase specialized sigma subunit
MGAKIMSDDTINFYDVVLLVQNGDKEAVNSIIESFKPLIRKTCSKMKYQDGGDLEQLMFEKIIYAVQSYNLKTLPDFNSFFETIFNNLL